MSMNMGLLKFRLVWALPGIVGLILQGIATEMTLPGYFTHLSLIVNFFSYFTILTNLFITIWFVLAFRSQFMGQARWWGDQPEIKGGITGCWQCHHSGLLDLAGRYPDSNSDRRDSKFFVAPSRSAGVID